MEFWGVEVKAGQTVKVEPGEDKVLHLSQASLGEVKKDKGNDSILLNLKIGDQKLVVGTLSAAKCTHISYDLVFEKEFELSHSWKNGSIYFCGYRSVLPDESDDFSDSEDDFGEEFPLDIKENGKPEDDKAKSTTVKANAAKTDSSAAKKVKLVDPKKGKKPEEDDDKDDEDDDSEEDDSDDEDMLDADDDSDDVDDDESSEEEDEATPKKGKKRPAESATKTDKKAKLVTPQKTAADGKKGGGHTATPYPKAGKTPASGDKSKQQTPKSAGQMSCKACSKTFNSDTALQAHSKAKHSGGK